VRASLSLVGMAAVGMGAFLLLRRQNANSGGYSKSPSRKSKGKSKGEKKGEAEEILGDEDGDESEEEGSDESDGDEVQDAVTVLITEPEEDVQASKPKRGNGKPKGAKANGKAKAKGGAAKKKTSVTIHDMYYEYWSPVTP